MVGCLLVIAVGFFGLGVCYASCFYCGLIVDCVC